LQELARLGHVSRTRVTQILNLLHLAPDIQERLLFLPAVIAASGGASFRDLIAPTRAATSLTAIAAPTTCAKRNEA
jgi:hypothetical protein